MYVTAVLVPSLYSSLHIFIFHWVTDSGINIMYMYVSLYVCMCMCMYIYMYTAISDRDPDLSVYFREWTPSELETLLIDEGPTGGYDLDADMYAGFVRASVPLLCRVSRRIGSIRAMLGDMWPAYREPLSATEAAARDGGRAVRFKRLAPVLRAVTSGGPWRSLLASERTGPARVGSRLAALSSAAKLLLLAAFIASRNAVALDAKVFTSTSSAGTKRQRRSNDDILDDDEDAFGIGFVDDDAEREKPRRRRRLKGGIAEQDHVAEEARRASRRAPGVVALERLLAIYNVLALEARGVGDSRSNAFDRIDWIANSLPAHISLPSQPVLACLDSLCAYRLLDAVGGGSSGGGDVLESGSAKFRCNIGQATAEGVAGDMGVMLQNFVRYS